MRFTGERVIPDRYELKPMLQEHLIRYSFALPYMQDADVIDLGCGCGYGTYLLATQGARSAVGVDLSPEAVEYARSHYQLPNLSFETMDVTSLAYPDNYFTGAVCLEVFEHVQDHEALLREVVRVLAPGGMLVLSTPNKQVWSPGRNEPINPWHVREFDREEFGHLVEMHLPEVHYWSQTTSVPIPFILANLRLQRYYVRNRSLVARLVEWLHVALMKSAMLPARLIPGAMDKNPNIIVPEEELPKEKQYFFVAAGRKNLLP
jgi:SAM-dependent methyltransferase